MEAGDLPHLILWHLTGVRCMAIWPMIVLAPVHSHRHWGVATPALPVEHSPNPGKKAQEDVAEVARCGLGALMCCMMRTGTHIPWMMQVNYTSPSNLHRMLATVRLRWKNKTQQRLKRTYASVASVGATCDSVGICLYKEKKKWRESVKYLHSRIDRARFWRREGSVLIADMVALRQEMEREVGQRQQKGTVVGYYNCGAAYPSHV